MLIRRMNIDDVYAAVEIEKQCFSQPWSEKSFYDSISREDTIFLVCELTDKKMGSALLVKNSIIDASKVDLNISNQRADKTELPICEKKDTEVNIACNQVVGYIGMYLSFDEASITNVAVLPGYRKMGIGEQLVANAKIAAKDAAAETIFLEVRVSNIPAISLYKKMGFQELGIRKNFYDHPVEDAYIMSCSILEVDKNFTSIDGEMSNLSQ